MTPKPIPFKLWKAMMAESLGVSVSCLDMWLSRGKLRYPPIIKRNSRVINVIGDFQKQVQQAMKDLGFKVHYLSDGLETSKTTMLNV